MEFAKKFMTEKAEKLNGKAAILGMFAFVGHNILQVKLCQILSKKTLFMIFYLGLDKPLLNFIVS